MNKERETESLTHDTPTSLVKTGIHEALKHILSVLTEAITTDFDYVHFLKHFYQRVKS